MATFPNISPDYGLQEDSEPKVRRVSFGDGYEQRLSFGLNQDPKTWPVTWSNITTAEADQIKVFLNARAQDSQSFNWTPPDTATAYKWFCEKWSRRLTAFNRWTVNATFRQVFEP